MKTKSKSNEGMIIVGGGIVGLTCALSLAHTTKGAVSITVIDAGDPSAQTDIEFDGRASAIAASSWTLFEHLSLAVALTGQTQGINDILISDGETGAAPSALTLHFDSTGRGRGPMGQMAENRHVRAALLKQIAQTDAITLIANAPVIDHVANQDGVTVTLESGAALSAKLLIAADGRTSRIRRRAGIEVTGWDYPQMGIVTTVAHDLPHDGVAHELFLPAGPFAILPLPDDKKDRHRSSIVWTDSTRAAKAAGQLPDALFEAELARRFGNHWGEVSVIAPRHIYPLGLQMAKAYAAPRIALIGDAAHAIHPIAGQGLNMGIRDAAALADVIAQALNEGRDIGSEATLDGYAQWRRFDNQMLAAATDIFNRLFSNKIAPLQHARRLGIAAIDAITPAKTFFIKEAAGEIGDLPTLLQP